MEQPYDKQAEKVRANLSTLIYATNVTPFKWFGNNYKCFFCDATFIKVEGLKDHTRVDHEGFYTDSILKSAVTRKFQIKLDIGGLKCKLCQEELDSISDCVEHIVQKHQLKYNYGLDNHFVLFKLSDDDLKCIYCDKIFGCFGPLCKHMQLDHSSGNIICETCGRNFVFIERLKKHIEIEHNKQAKYKCKICGKHFYNLTNKRNHDAVNHGTYSYSCDNCGDKFSSIYKLKHHKMKTHELASYECDLCPMKFFWKNHYMKHRNQVHLNIRVVCQVCGEHFHKNYLKTHMVTHTTERPFECEVCKKSFARKKTLTVHARTHVKKGHDYDE